MSHVSLFLCLFLSFPREIERGKNRKVKQQDRKKRNAVNSLDQIPIRIPTINTPQLADSSRTIDDFRALEDLRIGKPNILISLTGPQPNGNRTNKWDGFGWIERNKTRRLSQLTSTPASFQAAKTPSIGVSVMKHKSPLPGWT
jgi:hypothetical protein